MGLSGCSQNQTIESPSPIPDAVEQSDEALPTHDDIPLTESNSQLINANHEFAYDLFASVIENRRDENVLISPASVAIALAMTQNGATGDTQQAIANTLRLQNVGLEAINEFYQALVTDVQTFAPIDQDQNEDVQNNDEVEAVQLAIANSLWGRDGFMFDESFLGRMKAVFDADLRLLDFAKPDAPAQINQWVREKTNQRISQIIDTIDADQVMFLINAVYFNGPWTTAFDPAQTRDRPFTLLDGTEIQHPLMSQMGQFSYLETEAFQAIQLPYGADERFHMVVVLPGLNSPQEAGWTEFLTEELTAEQWDTWKTQFTRQQGMIQLPTFTLNDMMSLNSVLESMGMAIAFDPNQADFSGLSETPTFISQVNHVTFMEVTEVGTEAAAATSIGFSVTSVQEPVDPFEMVVDHPFAFGIYDTKNQVFLFLGTVVNPQ